MTAETDIAAIATGESNTALEVRTALTSVLARADAGGTHTAYTYLAAQIEPLAIEQLRHDMFSYAVGAAETKLLIASFSTRLGATGRHDARDPREPFPLRNVTLTGLQSTSTAAFIDPALPTYTDARGTYFDRIETLYELDTKAIGLAGGSDSAPLLPGPYGSIVTGVYWHDTTWVSLTTPRGITGIGFNLADEIGDAAGDDMRRGRRLTLPISKNIVAGVKNGVAGGPDTVLAGVTYVICPSTWGKVTDPNTYGFRDDFMAATLNTATTWTRTESAAGNVEIDTAFAWCKVRGNLTWGDNGIFSQDSVPVANGRVFECDVFINPDAGDADGNLIVGFHDGVGHSFADFAHGLLFTFSTTRRIQIFENGTSRGVVGPNPGWAAGKMYRIRITLDGAGGATYEMQGGTEYPAIGGATWTDVTPGTSSSATDPVHAGVSPNEDLVAHYVGDVKIY